MDPEEKVVLLTVVNGLSGRFRMSEPDQRAWPANYQFRLYLRFVLMRWRWPLVARRERSLCFGRRLFAPAIQWFRGKTAKRTCDDVRHCYYFVKRPSNPDKRQLAFVALARLFRSKTLLIYAALPVGGGDVSDESWPRRKKTCVITIIVIIISGYLCDGDLYDSGSQHFLTRRSSARIGIFLRVTLWFLSTRRFSLKINTINAILYLQFVFESDLEDVFYC